ncbi:MAG: uroporphyrinogen-III synthase [Terriglobia bacterium]
MRRQRSSRPLAGRRIVITRRREQAEGLREALRRKGAAVIEFPTIALEPPRSWHGLDRALEYLDDYAWVIFTSANGVEFFFQRLRVRRIRPRWRARVAAIGPATAAALRQRGLRADVVPIEYKAEGLLRALARREKSWRGKRVLLARAAKAREALPRALRRRGARVDVIEAYRTVAPRVSKKRIRQVFGRRKAGKPDAITFTSSSTVKNFFTLLGRRPGRRALAGVAVATIGPVTSRTARALGLRVAVEANPYTVPALVRALEKYFRGRRRAKTLRG